jgi:signal transduction histidine kinase
VSVHDNGDGIPAERQAHLFRSFEQCTEGGMETASTSTGLIVAKRLADLMGAAVGVNSRPGAGSEFWLEVPVA